MTMFAINKYGLGNAFYDDNPLRAILQAVRCPMYYYLYLLVELALGQNSPIVHSEKVM